MNNLSPVYIGEEAIHWLKGLETAEGQILILSDTNTSSFCLPLLHPLIPKSHSVHHVNIEAGEKHKNWQSATQIWDALFAMKADKKTILLCLGGGMICDLGGFAASIFKRGIRLIQIPTTLLGMTDAGIGGKTAVDYQNTKNLLGTYYFPESVLVLPDFLPTLPYKEWISGWAELWKHILLALPEEWEKIKHTIPHLHEGLLKKSIEVKTKIVKEDPFENGPRKLLNLGHTAGHAYEGWALETQIELSHGCAVALGIVAESDYGVAMGIVESKTHQEITTYFKKVFAPHITRLGYPESFEKWLSHDKKNDQGFLQLSLCRSPGECLYNVKAEIASLSQSMVKVLRELSY